MDRGPYGALTPEGKWVLKRPRDKHIDAKYKGLIDLGPSVAEALRTNGRGYVTIRTWHKPRKSRKRAFASR